MTEKQARTLQQFLRTLREAGGGALLLNYDGTLAPFRTSRHCAFPYPGVTGLLEGIMQAGHTRVVVIGGRRANDIINLLGISPYPEVWGSHGLQRLHPDGGHEMAYTGKHSLQALAEADRLLEEAGLRDLAEFKPGSVAVHWRGLDPASIQQVRDRVLWLWLPLAFETRMALLEFDGGVEIRPPGVDKATAVRRVLGELHHGVPVAYLGDDQTDEGVFRLLKGRGMSVLVRAEICKTVADIWLQPPRELMFFLSAWLEATGSKECERGITRKFGSTQSEETDIKISA